MTERNRIESLIELLDGQRALLGDAVVDSELRRLRTELARLSASPASQQRLKQVSVLFTDVVGSTALGESLDSEDTNEILDTALGRFTRIIDAHGGRVLKYTGDGLLAAFGTEISQEDDAERCVLAGLALLDEAASISTTVRREYGLDGLNIRVGANTGAVLLGGGVEAEANIRGAAVNLAARMEQSAPAGALRISHATYRHIHGLFDVVEQPPMTVKGVTESLTTYIVNRARPRTFRRTTRGVPGIATEMVGREQELQRLQRGLTSVLDEPRCIGITVVGDAGVGKSRLLYEFEEWCALTPRPLNILRSRAYPQSLHKPYGLLRDVVTSGIDHVEGAGHEANRERFCQRIVALFQDDDGADMALARAHLLGHLIGFDFPDSQHLNGIREDPRQIRNRAFDTAAQMFRRICARDGVAIVLLLDDLHWMDEGSLDFIEHLMRVDGDVPILILSLTRPELFDRRSRWATELKLHSRIDLAPLGVDASNLLASSLLRRFDGIPQTLHALLVDRAEGNPFYMEELLKMLVEAGVIVVEADRWRLLPGDLQTAAVPATLTGVLQARLDMLPARLRAALQKASVIGLVFWDQALAELDAAGAEALESLVNRSLIIARSGSAFEGMREYAFAHQLLQQVIYDGVLKRDRRELHSQVASWLLGIAASDSDDRYGAVAEHFERAGEMDDAAKNFVRAAERAAGRYAHQLVLQYTTRGLADEAHRDHEVRWRLLLLRQRALRFQGAMSAQDLDLDSLQGIADELDDDSKRAVVHLRRAVARTLTGDHKAAEVAARQSLMLARRRGLADVEVWALSALSGALRSVGDHAQARREALSALALARAVGDKGTEAELLNGLAVIATEQGDPAASMLLLRQSLDIERAAANRQGECAALINLGDCSFRLGDYPNARRDLEEALILARSAGLRGLESIALINLSSVAHFQLDHANAIICAEAAALIATDTANREYESFAQLCLGQAHLGQSQYEEANAAFSRCRDLFLDLQMPHLAVEAEAGIARVALERGRPAEAMLHIEPILAHMKAVGNLDGTEHPLLIRLTCYRVLAANAREDAEQMLARAYADLLASSARIVDPELRQGMLDNVGYHREILAAYRANLRGGGAAGR